MIPDLKNKSQTVLFIDPSSEHLAYVIARFDHKALECYIETSGMVWTKSSWSKGKRFAYVSNAFKQLLNYVETEAPTVAVTEQYFMNPKLRTGIAVIPTINGLLEMECHKAGDVDYHEVPPTAWRKVLNIKAIKDEKGKNDYKTPTATVVKQFVKYPEQIVSNITLKDRATPHDLTDVLAIMLATAKNNGYHKYTLGNIAFYPRGLIEKFNQ